MTYNYSRSSDIEPRNIFIPVDIFVLHPYQIAQSRRPHNNKSYTI